MSRFTVIRWICVIGLVATTSNAMARDRVLHLNADVGYVSIQTLPHSTSKINAIRLKALQGTALTLGANGALAWRSKQINQTLTNEKAYLDRAFNFNELLINNNVLPPVIVEGDMSMNLATQNAIRTADKTYQIVTPAHFISVAPTWRDYLWMSYKAPELPDHTLLPNTREEACVWNEYLAKGWKSGLLLANNIFEDNVNRLKRDYMGIVLYRRLLAQHMVSAPFVAKSDLGVTGDVNHIRINDRVLRITAESQLQTNSKTWTPIIVPAKKRSTYIPPK